MRLKSLMLCLSICVCGTVSAQENGWAPYFSNDELTVKVMYSDCAFPEKGLYDRYLMFRLENSTASEMKVSYTLDRSYNGKSITPDTNGFTFSLPAKGAVEGSCDGLTKGLHIYVKILNVEAKSVLSNFAISNLVVNGKKIEL